MLSRLPPPFALSAGTLSVSGSGTVVFSNANGISFGLDGSTITGSHNGLTSQSNPAFSAQGGSSTFQTLSFGNANGFTFSNNNGTVQGSYTVPAVTNSSWTVSDNASSATVARLAFTNLNGVTLSLSTGAAGLHTIVGSHNALTSQSNQAFSADGGSSTFQTLSFANGNGFTFSNNNGSVQGSYTVPTVPAQFSGGISTGGNTSGDTGVVTARLVFAGGNNITVSGSTNGGSATITISGPNVGGAQTGISGIANSETTYTSGSVTFRDLNGISWQSTTGQQLQITHALQFTSNTSNITSNALNTSVSRVINIIAATNNTGGGTASLSSNVSFSNANGATFYTSAGSAIALSYSVPTVTNSSWTVSDSVTSATVGRLAFTASNGLTLTLSTSNNGNHTVIGSYTVPTVTNSSWTVSDAATSGSVAQLAFTNLNGVTLSLSTGAGGSHTIVGSHNAITSQTNQTVGLYAVGNTTQNSSTTLDARTLSFGGRGNVSVGYSNGTIQISGLSTGNITALGNTTINSSGTYNMTGLIVGATGGLSVDIDANSRIIFSGPIYGVSTNGNTSGDTGVAGWKQLVLAGGNNITVSQSTNINGATVTFSGPNQFSAGISTGGNTSGDTGVVAGRVVFAGGNNITLSGSTNGGSATITISAPNLGAGAMSAGVSNLGNTAGSTGITGTQLVLVGSGVISLSQSTGANGGTVSILAPATSSLSATGWASISTNGSTISIGASTTMNVYAVGNTTGTSSGTVDIRTISLSGAGGISVAASNSGFVVSRPIMYDYEPYPVDVNGANTGVTNLHSLGTATSGIVYLWPLTIDEYVAARCINLVLSENFTTVGTSSGRQTGGLSWGLYTRGINGNTSRLSALTRQSFGFSVTGNNSSYTINYPTTTNTSDVSTGATNSAGSNITSQFTGQKLVALPINLTLAPGAYWLALLHTYSTSSNLVGLLHSVFGWNMGTTLQNLAPIGGLSTAFSGTYSDRWGGPWHQGMGSWTTAGNTNLPDSIGFNSITKGAVSNMPVMKFWSNQ